MLSVRDFADLSHFKEKYLLKKKNRVISQNLKSNAQEITKGYILNTVNNHTLKHTYTHT